MWSEAISAACLVAARRRSRVRGALMRYQCGQRCECHERREQQGVQCARVSPVCDLGAQMPHRLARPTLTQPCDVRRQPGSSRFPATNGATTRFRRSPRFRRRSGPELPAIVAPSPPRRGRKNVGRQRSQRTGRSDRVPRMSVAKSKRSYSLARQETSYCGRLTFGYTVDERLQRDCRNAPSGQFSSDHGKTTYDCAASAFCGRHFVALA